jgi:hypothetical protein
VFQLRGKDFLYVSFVGANQIRKLLLGRQSMRLACYITLTGVSWRQGRVDIHVTAMHNRTDIGINIELIYSIFPLLALETDLARVQEHSHQANFCERYSSRVRASS